MHCTWSCLKTIVFPLNSTKKSPAVQYFFRACDIWLQTALASKSYVSHGESMSVQIFVLMKIELSQACAIARLTIRVSVKCLFLALSAVIQPGQKATWGRVKRTYM